MSAFLDCDIGGEQFVLCTLDPNWSQRPKITHRFEAEITEAETGLEAIEPQQPIMRLALEYRYTFTAPGDAQDFQDCMISLQGKRLLLPLVPDSLPYADYFAQRIYAAQLWIAHNGPGGNIEINGNTSGYPYAAGLVSGRLAERPRIAALTDLHGTVVVRLEQDSRWEHRVAVNTLALPAWNLEADWAVRQPEAGTVTQLRTRRIGRGLQAALEHRDSPAKPVQLAGYSRNTREEVRQLLTFWSEHRGPHLPFTLAPAFRPGWDLVAGHEPTLQVRFAQEELTLEYRTQDTARTQLSFQQALQVVEGEPSQSLPARARLYKFWWDGSATLKTYTDWMEPLVFGGSTYEPKGIDHRAEAETLRPGTADWEIICENFAGNPFKAFSLLSLERRLKVEIREGDPEDIDNAALIFAGEIAKAPRTGGIYHATAVLLGGALQRQVPGFYCKPGCNHTAYDAECGANPATFKSTGVLAVSSGTTLDITSAAAQAADYFALGYIAIGAGDAIELRFIQRSAPIAGGQRLTVHRPLVTSAVGAAVEFFPGCDSQFTGGCVKLGRQDDFGGAPYWPAYIDSVSTGYKTKVGK